MKEKFYRASAFSLVEVTLALGVAAFALVAVLGLLPAGIQTNQASIQQTTANAILSQVITDMRSAPRFPPGLGVATKQFTHPFPNAPSQKNTVPLYFHNDGSPSGPASDATTADADTTFYATVTFLSGTGGRAATLYDVKVAWPYAASGNGNGNNGTPVPRGYVETVVALDIN
jgi:uncharacterized protein (TIGR02598 family)